MNIARTGIILNVEKYAECVAFYRDIFGLKALFATAELTCFAFGGSYLMIETEGFAKPAGKTLKENSTKLRFNVADMEQALRNIQAHGLQAGIEKYSWGSTINIHDPDGNRIGIRDEAGFLQQMQAGAQLERMRETT